MKENILLVMLFSLSIAAGVGTAVIFGTSSQFDSMKTSIEPIQFYGGTTTYCDPQQQICPQSPGY